jgi:hypothetical protein
MFVEEIGEASDNFYNGNNSTRIIVTSEGEPSAKCSSRMNSLRMLMPAIGEGSDNLQNENNVRRTYM